MAVFIGKKEKMMNKNEKAIIKALEDMKANDVKFYDVRGKNPLCDSIIVCTALNERNLNALSEEVQDVAEKNKMKINHIEGRNCSTWIIVDLNDVVVHIMSENERARINLDNIIEGK